jgi:Bacterial Ig-like domain
MERPLLFPRGHDLLLKFRPLLLTLALLLALAPLPASAASVHVLNGSRPETRIMPSNLFTVADAAQLTGIRINLPLPACDNTDYSICDDLRLLNLQDGFDLRPRVTVPFSGPIDVASVTPADFYVTGPSGFRTPIVQLVWDPKANVLAGEPSDFLLEATRYRVVVGSGIRDAAGQPVTTCDGSCGSSFTTETATPELAHLRAALDASTPATAGLVQNGTRDVFPAATVTEIDRGDQVYADPARPLAFSQVLNAAVANAGYYAFGSLLVPRYQTYADAIIPNVPTSRTPLPVGTQRVGFTLIVPAGPTPAGGWPVAIFGPGFTRSKYDPSWPPTSMRRGGSPPSRRILPDTLSGRAAWSRSSRAC